MDSLRIDTTYGSALYEVAEDTGKIDSILEDLKNISIVFEENPDLKKLFFIPTISLNEKKAVAKEVFSGRVETETLSFLQILLERRRIGAWDGIVKQFVKIKDGHDGVTKGIVYSVVPLTAENLAKLEEETGNNLSKKVKLENRIDEMLIGGIVIYIDGKLIDLSIKKRLESLKKAILK